jgi:hypothetical protein
LAERVEFTKLFQEVCNYNQTTPSQIIWLIAMHLQLQQAYQTLSDDRKRRDYEAEKCGFGGDRRQRWEWDVEHEKAKCEREEAKKKEDETREKERKQKEEKERKDREIRKKAEKERKRREEAERKKREEEERVRMEEEADMPPPNEQFWDQYREYQRRMGEDPEEEARRKAKWDAEALRFYDRYDLSFDDYQRSISKAVAELEEAERHSAGF